MKIQADVIRGVYEVSEFDGPTVSIVEFSESLVNLPAGETVRAEAEDHGEILRSIAQYYGIRPL